MSEVEQVPFEGFQKIPRWKRDIVITEKIDGTNAQIYFLEDGRMLVGSRNRWITPEKDNMGFAAWCKQHEEELRLLGYGKHFGEWYGAGIQRRYGLDHKRFALFNSSRWTSENPPPTCCSVVPVLYKGPMSEAEIDNVMEKLRVGGSVAVPGFMNPEGIVIYHVASRSMFKRTLVDDEQPKTNSVKSAAADFVDEFLAP